MTIEELEKKMKGLEVSFQEKIELQAKSFNVQLEASKKDGEQWKTVAQAKEEEARQFKEKAEKADAEKAKAFAEAKKAEIKAFFAEAKKDGKITPAMEEVAMKLAESMTSETVIATFDKSDGSKTTHTQLSLFKSFISMLGKTRVFAEHTAGGGAHQATPKAGSGAAGEEQFSEVIYGGVKKPLPMEDTDLHARAVAFQDEARTAGRSVSYEDALCEIGRQIKAEA